MTEVEIMNPIRRYGKKLMVALAIVVMMSSIATLLMRSEMNDMFFHTGGNKSFTVVAHKGIWVWGSTIRGKEDDFMLWVNQHNYSDIFVLIKGVSGVVKYDVLNTILTLKHQHGYKQRIWAWLVGFHDESHADSSWDYLVGDWISPADEDYRNYLVNIVRNAIDPSRGYVSYSPYGVMLDDTFQWPSSSYGSSTSYRVSTIMNAVDAIKNEIDSVENTTSEHIVLGFAPHPETDYYASDGNGGYYTYAAYEYGQDFGELSSVCDYIVPETYRYGFYNEPSSWITDVVNDIRNEISQEQPSRIDDVHIYPALILYYSDSDPTPVSASSLHDDITAALNATTGFSVFRFASSSSNPGNGDDSYDLPSLSQTDVLDNFVPTQSAEETLSEALDSQLSFSTGGDAKWFVETNCSYYGNSAAQSGKIADGELTWLSTEIQGPGNVTFMWKISSEQNEDFLRFYVDDVLVAEISGDIDWQAKSYPIQQGAHTLKWIYEKDSANSDGEDSAWLDYVQWYPSSSGSNDPWNHTEFGDNRDLVIYHQQPTYYNDPGFSSGSYKGWCGVASSYIVLHSLDHDLPARLKTKYPSWSDPDFSRELIEADPYVYHWGSTYAIESLMVNEGIGYDSGTSGYSYSELTKIYDWLNSLNMGVHFEYKFIPLADLKTYLQDGWMAIMNVQTGHYVAVVAYTYDDPSVATKRYYWILDPWPTSYIGPGTPWDPTTADPDGDGKNEFNVDLTWEFRRLIWSRQPNGTSSYYQGIYVMTGEGVNDVFRDQLGDGTLLVLHTDYYDSQDRYVLFEMPAEIPNDAGMQNNTVRLLKMVNGYLYSRVAGIILEENVSMHVMYPSNGTWIYKNIPKGSIILKGVSDLYACQAAYHTFGYSSPIFRVDMENVSSVVHVLKLKAPRILLYTGSGTIYQRIYDTLVWMRFHVDAYSDPSKLDRLLDKSFRYSIIFIPGGSATEIASGIGENRLHEIAQFVADGGGYIGVCAGSYLPIKGYNTETSWLEIVNATVENTNPGEGEVVLHVENENDPVMFGFNGEFTMMYYNGPPLILGGLNSSTLGLEAPYPISLATFESGVSSVLYGKTAILHTTYGNGSIVLFSPHPEHDEIFPGRYLWRLFWNAIYTVSGENTTIGGSGYIPEFADYTPLILILVSLLIICIKRFH